MSVELLCPQWIVPVVPADTVLDDHAVALEGERILAVLPRAEAFARWPQARRTELPGQVLIPGLVNLHTHAAMALLRGVGDDLPLQQWLQHRIWPIEAALMSPEFVFDGSVLAAQEMLRGGITCFNDMYFFPEQTARAALALGMRAQVGIIVIEFPSVYGSGPADYLSKGLQARDHLREEPLIGFTLSPHAPYTVSDDSFRRVASLSAELGLPIHCHLHETAFEIEDSLRQHGRRPLERLVDLGLVGPELIAVHAVHLSPGDIECLAQRGASVAHCPHSNLKLASGIAPVAALRANGVGVGIGTDGSASNNRLDLLGEGRTAALLAKAASGDASACPAHAMLRAMTLDGARALGLADTIGSIEPGKFADMVSVDLGTDDLAPVYDPVSQLIYAAGRDAVDRVWVSGSLVVSKRQLTRPTAAGLVSEVVARSGLWHNRIGEIVG
jgi:5-methylthioadenosine/S-adenosylhomocysteine deaminase